jgi:hypothetical protein
MMNVGASQGRVDRGNDQGGVVEVFLEENDFKNEGWPGADGLCL